MKSGLLNCLAVVTLSIGLMGPAQLAAQDAGVGKQDHHHYKLTDLGALGGTSASVAAQQSVSHPRPAIAEQIVRRGSEKTTRRRT